MMNNLLDTMDTSKITAHDIKSLTSTPSTSSEHEQLIHLPLIAPLDPRSHHTPHNYIPADMADHIMQQVARDQHTVTITRYQFSDYGLPVIISIREENAGRCLGTIIWDGAKLLAMYCAMLHRTNITPIITPQQHHETWIDFEQAMKQRVKLERIAQVEEELKEEKMNDGNDEDIKISSTSPTIISTSTSTFISTSLSPTTSSSTFTSTSTSTSTSSSTSSSSQPTHASDIMYEPCLDTPYHFLQGKRVLELGAGTGMLGLMAIHCGAQHVVLTDVDELVPLMSRNVTLNFPSWDPTTGYLHSNQPHIHPHARITCQSLWWGPHDQPLPSCFHEPFDVILMSDVVYDAVHTDITLTRNHSDLVYTINEMSHDNTIILLTYTRRKPNESQFFDMLSATCVWRHIPARSLFAQQSWLDSTHHSAIDERVYLYHIHKSRLSTTQHARGASTRLCTYLENESSKQDMEWKQKIINKKLQQMKL